MFFVVGYLYVCMGVSLAVLIMVCENVDQIKHVDMDKTNNRNDDKTFIARG